MTAVPAEELKSIDNKGIPKPTGSVFLTGIIDQSVVSILDAIGLIQSDSDIQSAAGLPEPESEAPAVVVNLKNAANLLDQHPTAYLVLFYQNPLDRLAARIQGHDPLESAVTDCKAYALSVLELYRGHRRRITMIDVRAFEADPNEAIKAIEGHVPLRLKEHTTARPIETSSGTDLPTIVAGCVLQENYELRLLANEIEAGSTLHSVDTGSSVSLRLLGLRDELDAASQDQSEQNTEKELLLLQLHQIQDELEVYFKRSQDLEQSLSAKEADTKRVGRELQTALAEKSHLLKVEEELQTVRKEKARLAKIESDLRKQVAIGKKRLTDLKQSRSWRYLAPLRGLRHLIAPKK